MKPKYKTLIRWLESTSAASARQWFTTAVSFPRRRRTVNTTETRQLLKYQSESWRDDEPWQNDDARLSLEEKRFARRGFMSVQQAEPRPDVRDQTMVLELLGRVNYKIIKGKKVYIEVDGIVYKTLYGGYWRSVFTGIEHYLLRCEQVSGSVWADESSIGKAVDLPVAYSNDGWTASGHSLSFMLSRD